ncbi:hypothetical protein D3C72_1592010 [compost metagenome]
MVLGLTTSHKAVLPSPDATRHQTPWTPITCFLFPEPSSHYTHGWMPCSRALPQRCALQYGDDQDGGGAPPVLGAQQHFCGHYSCSLHCFPRLRLPAKWSTRCPAATVHFLPSKAISPWPRWSAHRVFFYSAIWMAARPRANQPADSAAT